MYEDDNFFWETVEDFMMEYPITFTVIIFGIAILLVLFGSMLIAYLLLIPFFVAVVLLAIAILKFLKWGIKRHNQ